MYYIYIDAKKVLLEKINQGVLDVYYADDTHWSPIGAEIIANEIVRKIKEFEEKQQNASLQN